MANWNPSQNQHSSSIFQSYMMKMLDPSIETIRYYDKVIIALQWPWEQQPDELRELAATMAHAHDIELPAEHPRRWSDEEGWLVIAELTKQYSRRSDSLRPTSNTSRDMDQLVGLSKTHQKHEKEIIEKQEKLLDHQLEVADQIALLNIAGVPSIVSESMLMAGD